MGEGIMDARPAMQVPAHAQAMNKVVGRLSGSKGALLFLGVMMPN